LRGESQEVALACVQELEQALPAPQSPDAIKLAVYALCGEMPTWRGAAFGWNIGDERVDYCLLDSAVSELVDVLDELLPDGDE
jgi:hypothetical protein